VKHLIGDHSIGPELSKQAFEPPLPITPIGLPVLKKGLLHNLDLLPSSLSLVRSVSYTLILIFFFKLLTRTSISRLMLNSMAILTNLIV